MKKALALTVLAGIGLAACDDNEDRAQGITTLGQTFVNAFQQDRNDEPILLDGVTIPNFPRREPFDV